MYCKHINNIHWYICYIFSQINTSLLGYGNPYLFNVIKILYCLNFQRKQNDLFLKWNCYNLRDNIFKCVFLDLKKNSKILLKSKFHWSSVLKGLFTISQKLFRWWLYTQRQQTITELMIAQFSTMGIEAACHIYVSVIYAMIGLDNSLLPVWHQVIIWTNLGILLIGPLGFSMILEWKCYSFLHKNACKIVVCKMIAILFLPQMF